MYVTDKIFRERDLHWKQKKRAVLMFREVGKTAFLKQGKEH